MKFVLASFALTLIACTHKQPTPIANAASAPAAPATTTTTTTTATAATTDAGATADAAASDASSGKATVFDRILAKAKDQSATPDALKATVEAAANAKVKSARRTAVHWLLFQFEPTASGRTADDQQKLIDALKATGVFEAVEGDRLMKVQ